MSIWFVHRNGGPGTPISSAHQYNIQGYNDEQLDDAVSAELQTFLNAARAVRKNPNLGRLLALLVSKGVLSAADLPGLNQ